jgi:hypothetical protein
MKHPDNRRHGRRYRLPYTSDPPMTWTYHSSMGSTVQIHRSEMIPYGSIRKLSRISSKEPFTMKWTRHTIELAQDTVDHLHTHPHLIIWDDSDVVIQNNWNTPE